MKQSLTKKELECIIDGLGALYDNKDEAALLKLASDLQEVLEMMVDSDRLFLQMHTQDD